MIIKGSKDLITDFTDAAFYEVLDHPDADWNFLPGQLYWSHIAYPETHPKILKMVKYDPRSDKNTEFKISHYSDGDENHYPLHELGLREGELFYVYKGKKRLVVVLGYSESSWIVNKPQEYILCAPVFSFKPQHTQEIVIKTQAFNYPNLFYLPPDKDGCPNESAIRFEMIQPVVRNCLDPFFCTGKRKPVRLSEEGYWILLCHLLSFLKGKVLDKEVKE